MYTKLSRAARILLAPAALLLALAASDGAGAQQRVPERAPRAFPQMNLMVQQSLGQDAVNRLGPQLDAIAAWYGKSPDQLRRQLLSDRSMRIDRAGRLFVVDELTTPLRAPLPPNVQQTVMDGQLAPLDQTFRLHSKPGSNRTVYLNFVGAKISGTAWNTSTSSITALPFDTDGNTGSFSTAELQRIQYIWQRVAEDYAPFDVDITTEPPAADAITRSSSTDQVYGTTVVITKSTGVYPCSCGGIAYVGVFNYIDTTNYYKPALVFYDMLGPGNEKYVAEAVSHEAGHNMGLSHDGTTTGTEYYAGQGTGAATGWAPIMGVGYYQPLVQFSKGEYANAKNTEDDFAVAQTYGLPLRTDDYGNSTAAASPFVASISAGSASGKNDGVIEQAGDSDFFAVAAGAGSFSASVTPAGRSPNADLVLTLFGPDGLQLATSNPVDTLNASVSYNLPAQGTYYLKVNGTGFGNPAVSGYSNYGSVGYYRVSATYAAPAGTPPLASFTTSATSGTAPLAVTFNAAASSASDSDGKVNFWYWDFGDGTGSTTGTLVAPSKTYQVAGTYTVRLTVVDERGLSASSTQTVTVTSGTTTTTKTVSVKSIQMSLRTNSSGYATATGVVTVVNQAGQLMPGATVGAKWTGIVSRTSSGTTGSTGTVSFSSPSTRSRGCFSINVTGITLSGYTFQQSAAQSNQICR